MACIFVWQPMYGNIGHVSLRASPDLYISFWPNGDAHIFNPSMGGKAATYDNDCEYEGEEDGSGHRIPRGPDQIKRINGKFKNIRELKTWWRDFKNGEYHLMNQNCCEAVRKALEVGDLDDKREYASLIEFVNTTEKIFTGTAVLSFGGFSGKQGSAHATSSYFKRGSS